MLKVVVFDLDGTLLDTIPDIAANLNRALAERGFPTHPVEKCKTFVVTASSGPSAALCRMELARTPYVTLYLLGRVPRLIR